MVVDDEVTEVTVIAVFTRLSFSSILDPGLSRFNEPYVLASSPSVASRWPRLRRPCPRP